MIGTQNTLGVGAPRSFSAHYDAMNDSFGDDIVDYDGYGEEHFGSHSADSAFHGDDERELGADEDDQPDDDMMDRISSSPSIDDEDIDFEFVYALHTFIATVDGQANASKGDTMVLLDDSNSYWWLVRVVKDGTIGYLPAEHIETPTERLARLNKHRNIDVSIPSVSMFPPTPLTFFSSQLSSTMLSDNAEKSKHPLKKVMRRKKNVMFAAPTYIEPSDAEWSTDDEDGLEDQFFDYDDDGNANVHDEDAHVDHHAEDHHHEDEHAAHDNMAVEPLRPRSQSDKEQSSNEKESVKPNLDPLLTGDSFETKKISLTPNLLRDDNQTLLSPQYEIKEKGRGSMDSWDRIAGLDKPKDDKRKKEKKSVLSGLFKRKDKRNKSSDDDNTSDHEKMSEDSYRPGSSSQYSIDSSKGAFSPISPTGDHPAFAQQAQQSQQQQREFTAHPGQSSTSLEQSDSRNIPSSNSTTQQGHDLHEKKSDGSAGDDMDSYVPRPLNIRNSQVVKDSNPAAPFGGDDQRDTYLSDPDSSSDNESMNHEDNDDSDISIKLDIADDAQQHTSGPRESQKSLTTPAVNIHASSSTSLTEEPQELRARSTTPSTDRDEARTPELTRSEEIQVTLETTSSSAGAGQRSLSPMTPNTLPLPSWSDANLRSYLDDTDKVRDLWIIVHDKSNIIPAGPDHPITGKLFKEETKTLDDMSNRLDDLLNNWLTRKGILG
ncbi:hypothetical protein KEM56_002459 [Ascosphaera pollenicola]|nr:hypothetical protein KEM56_002459 [Ascosphaera pollenicola]